MPLVMWKVVFLLIFFGQLAADDGVRYRCVRSNPWIIHIAEIDPELATIEIVKCSSGGVGLEKTSEVAKRKNAIAAINGGFFYGEFLPGGPSGILKIDEELYSSTDRARGAIGWHSDDLVPLIDRLDSKIHLCFSEKDLPIDGINKPRKNHEAVIYTPKLFPFSPNEMGRKYLIGPCELIETVLFGEMPIEKHSFVLSLGPENFLEPASKGPAHLCVELLPQFHPENQKIWESFDQILGATPVLVMDGFAVEDFLPEKTIETFLTMQYARSGIGVKPDGTLVLAMVEGKVTKRSEGMTIQEWANFFESLGCQHALNLVGGSSSTFYYKGMLVTSERSESESSIGSKQKFERPVSNVLIVKSRNMIEK